MTDNFEKDSSQTTGDSLECIHDANIIISPMESAPPKLSHMERFLALQQRRIEITKGSTERRINELRATIVANVEKNLQAPDEMEALKQCDVDIAQLSASTREAVEGGKRKRKRGKRVTLGKVNGKDDDSSVQSSVHDEKKSDVQLDVSSDVLSTVSRGNEVPLTRPNKSNLLLPIADDSPLPTCFGKQPEKRVCLNAASNESSNIEKNTWQKIRPFLTVNDHLITTTGSSRTPVSSHLEEQLESAIKARDMQKAEELSDRLATREFGVRIVGAIEAKKYTEEKASEKERKAAASKKKLAWGFVQKHRWETKGNM